MKVRFFDIHILSSFRTTLILYHFFVLKGGAVSQALKRAKILDSDNEDEPAEVQVEGNQISAGLIDGGDSSDEGVRNDDDDKGYVFFS